MQTIAVWHGSLDAAVAFANEHATNTNSGLVAMVPDPEMRFAWWGFYRVTRSERDAIAAIPRLTYKG